MIPTPARPRRAGLLAASAAAAFGLWALGAAAQTTDAPAPSVETGETAEAQAVPQPVEDIVMGQADAPVTVIEYASFTCSHCGDFATDSFPKLKAEYIDTGKVKYIQRDVYFDAVGLWAGILAHCDPSKYYAIGEELLTTQDKWLSGAKTGDQAAENLRKVGLAAGMTAEQMDACWKDQAMVERLVSTYQVNASKDGIEGTPTFIINGEKVPNQPWDGLKAKIEEKLAAAPAPAAPADPAAPAEPAEAVN